MSELGRRWRILLGAFIGIGAGSSSLYFYSLGLFLKPLAETFHWSRAEASLGPLVGTLGAALFAVPTGVLMDRVGPVRTAVGSTILLALGLAALGVATRGLASFLWITALLSVTTVGTTPLSYTRLIVGLFDRRRGLALGAILISSGLVGALMPNILAPFIAEHGWKPAYLVLAATVAAATIPLAVLIRGAGAASGPAEPRRPTSAGPLFVTARFQLLAAVFFLSATGALGAVVHLPALVSDMGANPRQIGLAAGSVGMSAIAGRIAAGLLLDRFSFRWVTAGFFLVSGAGVCSLPLGGPESALAGALLLGLSIGAEAGLLAYLVSRLFAPAAYGRAYGAAYSLFLVGGAVGPLVLGLVFDRVGAYRPAYLLAGACLITASLLALAIPDKHSRIIGHATVLSSDPVDQSQA